ncbi:MAG: hypothetical protein V2I38_02155 [Alcanivoracaceae bacterium]|jgi:hypothetical protein|nr:hypothetical protein [Alcanivoracaceae bacterium]
MIYRSALLAVIAVLLVGCATPKSNYQPALADYKTEASGEPKLAAPGDVLLNAAHRMEGDSLYLTQLVKIGIAYKLSRGYYDKKGDDSKAEYFYPASGPEAGNVDRMALADPWKAIMVPKNGRKVCVVTIFKVKACAATADYEMRKREMPYAQSYDKTLYFYGVDGDDLLFEYREKAGGIDKPEARKIIRHEPEDGDIVQFGSLRIRVLSVAAGHLTYQVLPAG